MQEKLRIKRVQGKTLPQLTIGSYVFLLSESKFTAAFNPDKLFDASDFAPAWAQAFRRQREYRQINQVDEALKAFYQDGISKRLRFYVELYNSTCWLIEDAFWQKYTDKHKRFLSLLRDYIQVHHGWVYLVQKEGTNLYKIGKSNQPDVRLTKFEVVMPFAIKPLHLIECNDYDKAERLLHAHFASCRQEGEWFRLDEQQVSKIRAIERL